LQPTRQEPDWLPTLRYVLPFGVFVAFLALNRVVEIPHTFLYSAQFICVLAALMLVSRPVISWQPSSWFGSVVLGVAVFVIWIAPDALWPGYRQHWLFTNSLTGSAESSIPSGLRTNVAFIAMRASVCTLLVPVLEELFWRGWMMRWLISKDFLKLPAGAYTAESFWLVAFLFASEHGPYWEVGLLAGIAYNWWLMRTRNLADCILAHAVTNLCLSAYVVTTGNWQYWL
jgi:hypothetical protein